MPDLQYEQAALSRGYHCVCGCDEAGAGPLAGPVYAAAVILPENFELAGLNDSKKLTAKKREQLCPIVESSAVCWAVAAVDAEEIDRTDILSARISAMQKAIDALSVNADFALIDGNRDKGKSAQILIPHQCVIGGDGVSMSIAAASVLAKVHRDRAMLALAAQYPEYGFAQHKGYGTKLHYQRLREFGACAIHRRTFLKNL